MADGHTRFQNAVVLREKTSELVWILFVEFWASFFSGYHAVIRLDQEAVITAQAFCKMALANGIQLQFSDAQLHNSLGGMETYCEPLRRVFRILRLQYPIMESDTILRYGVKRLTGMIGPSGLVPSLLVSGSLPTFFTDNHMTDEQRTRMGIMETARKKVARIRADQRVDNVLKSNIPPSEN